MEILNLPGPKARSIIERDLAVISPSYPRGYPFVMDHGRGVQVWDVDNNRFLDFAAGIAVVSTGHSHPKVVKAIQDQAEKFIHISSDYYHIKWVELGEYLNRIAPFDEPATSYRRERSLAQGTTGTCPGGAKRCAPRHAGDGARTCPMNPGRTQFSVWRTGSGGGPCAGRISYARRCGRRGSGSRRRAGRLRAGCRP